MSGSYFEQKDLQELQKILQSKLGLEIAGDELHVAAISCVRVTAAKLLRYANLLNNINLNGGKQHDENSKAKKE